MANKVHWIQGATEDWGSYRRSVKNRYGKKGFTIHGTIKTEIVNKDAKKAGRLGKQARLAKVLRKVAH
jgi:hypothetical protein